MPKHEVHEDKSSAWQTAACGLGMVVVCAWFVTQTDTDPYGPYRYDGVAQIDLVSSADGGLSPLLNTQLNSQTNDVSVSLHQCSENLSKHREFDGAITHLAATAIELSQPNQVDVSLVESADQSHAVVCHTAEITLPDSIVATVQLPITYQLQQFLDTGQVPESAHDLRLDFSKVPNAFNEYYLVPAQNKTIWERHQIVFVPSGDSKR